MHRPWILLGATLGLLTPRVLLAQPASEAPGKKSDGEQPAVAPGTGTEKPAPAAAPAAAKPKAAPSAQGDESAAPEPSSADAAGGTGAPDASSAPQAAAPGEAAADSEPPAPPPAPPGSTPGAPNPPDEEEPELPMTPPAPDTLGGHFIASAAGGVVNPWGRYSKSMAEGADWGWLVGGDLGYGVSRSIVLGAWAHYQGLPGPDSCSDCTATSLGVGPLVRFHLVQGLRFDPWMEFSVGYRSSTLESEAGSLDFSGFDWARLRVGGDWYGLDNLGFGPFMEFNSGGFTTRPEGSGGLKTHWHFATGFRLVLDVPGKP